MKLICLGLVVLSFSVMTLIGDETPWRSVPNLLSQVRMDEKTAEVVAKIEKAIDPTGMLKRNVPFQFRSCIIRTDAAGIPQTPFYTVVSGEFPGRLRIDVFDESKEKTFVLFADGSSAKTVEKGGKITELSPEKANLLRRQLLAVRSFYAVAEEIRLTGEKSMCNDRSCMVLAFDFSSEVPENGKITDRILIDEESMLPQMLISNSEPKGVTRFLQYTDVEGVKVATLSEMVAPTGEKTLISLQECRFDVTFPKEFWSPETFFAKEGTGNL